MKKARKQMNDFLKRFAENGFIYVQFRIIKVIKDTPTDIQVVSPYNMKSFIGIKPKIATLSKE